MSPSGRFVIDFIRDALADRAFGGPVARVWRVLHWLVADLRTTVRRPASPVTPSLPRSWSLTMQQCVQDVRLAFRSFARSPLFTVVAVVTLALGIGASTTVFAIADGSVLRPFPYPDTPRIMRLTELRADNTTMSVSYPNFLDWRAQNDAFEELGLFRNGSATLNSATTAERIVTATMSASVFDTLGLQPLLGRRFDATDDGRAEPVVVISERLWRSRFGAAPDIVGTAVTLNGLGHTIVGVMPAAMRFPGRTTEAWLPLGLMAPQLPTARDNHPGLIVLGRLRQGVSLEQARASMAAVATRLGDAYPATNGGNSILVEPYAETVVGDVRPALLAFLGASGLVLLIACGNLVNMLLARGEMRRPEMAMRVALGASRSRLVRQLLTEAGILVTAGTVGGLAVSAGLVSIFVASRPSSVPRLDLIGIDWRVAAFAAAVALVTTTIVGVIPALRASRTSLHGKLEDGRRAGSGRSRLRGALITAEVALALILLVGAGLLMKSFAVLMSRDLGYRPEQVVTMRLSLPDARYPTPDAWVAFHSSLRSRFDGLPGVKAVGLTAALPLEGVMESTVMREGDAVPLSGPQALGGIQVIDGSYFDALDTHLAAGRTFNDRDTSASLQVAIIDDAGAKRMFPGESALGRRIAFETGGDPQSPTPIWREIVGIVPHIAQYGLTGEPEYPQVFVPFGQLPTYMRERRPAMAIVARADGNPDVAVAALRGIVSSMDPSLPLFGVRTLTSLLDDANESQRLGRLIFSSVSLLALTLAAIGIYGVLSYTVSQRTREIGVRVALGANRSAIVSLIAGQAGGLVLLGLALGGTGAVLLSRFVATLLVDVSTTDPGVIAGAAVVLGAAAFAAALIPARRAASIDPVDALRD